jgi:hypothetical protein
MKRSVSLAIFSMLLAFGCSRGTQNNAGSSSPPPGSTVMKLKSGKEVIVLSVGRVSFPNDPPALMLKYQTDIKISNKELLRTEVEEIWEQFQLDVEKEGLTQAIVSANEPPTGGLIQHNRTYNFVYKKMPTGKWQMQ